MAAKNGSLQQALTALFQSQATLTQAQAQFMVQMAEIRDETARRFLEIMQILLRHEQILQQLPEAIKQKIGFKAK
jgi:hypothetical protein